jgi:hypothetical protein
LLEVAETIEVGVRCIAPATALDAEEV